MKQNECLGTTLVHRILIMLKNEKCYFIFSSLLYFSIIIKPMKFIDNFMEQSTTRESTFSILLLALLVDIQCDHALKQRCQCFITRNAGIHIYDFSVYSIIIVFYNSGNKIFYDAF